MTKKELDRAIYATIGQELIDQTFSPSAMAKAIEKSNGDKVLVQSLYTKFRYEEHFEDEKHNLKPEQTFFTEIYSFIYFMVKFALWLVIIFVVGAICINFGPQIIEWLKE